MTITNDAQAEAARKFTKSVEDFDREFGMSISLQSAGYKQAVNALSAYEAQKAAIVLSELEMAVLLQSQYAQHEIVDAIKKLRSIRLVTYANDSKLQCHIMDAGRAYLAQKTRELKWEVIGGDAGRSICLSGDARDAQVILNALSKYFPDGHYEVREVR